MQDRAAELGGLDRVLPALPGKRFADEHHAGEPVKQAEFADRVADIDFDVRDPAVRRAIAARS